MSNFAADIERVAKGEPIEAVIIGDIGWRDENNVPQELLGKVLSWDAAKLYLDYEFNAGYGGVECHAVYVYTKTRVIAVSQYDGSTGLFSIPRDPMPGMPDMPGG